MTDISGREVIFGLPVLMEYFFPSYVECATCFLQNSASSRCLTGISIFLCSVTLLNILGNLDESDFKFFIYYF